MHSRLRTLLVVLTLSVSWLSVFAQLTITTQVLPQPAVCPGTSIEVPFLVTGTTDATNAFSIQLASGTDFIAILTSTIVGNPATGQYTATTTLPAAIRPGTYRVRVVASSPATVGSVSTTALLVKTQPATTPILAAQSIGNFTSQYTFCQNDAPLSLSILVGPVPDNYRVQYDLGNGLASTTQRTFTAPVITPTTVGRTTYNFRYVVVDAAKGCNPAEQSGTIAFLNTEVKLRPAAPALPASSLTYCQNQATNPLQANATTNGSDFLWYSADDKVIPGSSPMPQTTQQGVTTYQVAQSLDRCEGPRATVTVTVQAASALPTAPKTRIDLCRGATAQPLAATGTNLIWTDPTGTTSTAAPTPATLNASKTTDGDLYYVTQTTNGCPSNRLAIRVLVQAQTTLSLTGGTNINLGTEFTLSLGFSSTGPYRYRITTVPASITLSGTATKDTALVLLPERSVVYQVAEVSNGCGVGLPGSPATATVTVLVPTIRTTQLITTTACAGSPVTVSFQTTGSFNPGSAFRMQVAKSDPDSTKIRFADMIILQQVGASQLTSTMPATATSGTYLIRVIATNPKIPILGTASQTTLLIKGQSTATLATTTPTIVDGDVAKLAVTLTGDGPWTFTYRDSTDVLGAVQNVTTGTSPYTLELKPRRTTTYVLTGISSGCAATSGILGRVLVTVSPLLTVEPLAGLVDVYPVPTTTYLTVRINTPLTTPATLELLDSSGRVTSRQQTQQTLTNVPTATQPAGVYLLRIEVNGQVVTKRVVKM